MLLAFKRLREQALALVSGARSNTDLDRTLVDGSSLAAEVADLEQGAFRIAVVAPFSAGKSTFINALMGTDLLSSSELAETATATRMRYGAEPSVTVRLQDGRAFTVTVGPYATRQDLKSLLKVVSAIPHNAEDRRLQTELIDRYLPQLAAMGDYVNLIRDVVVGWPLDLCRDGVELIDTPGLQRCKEHNQITGEILPEADAVIFIVDSEKIGQDEFTAQMRRYVTDAMSSNLAADELAQNIFFLISKADRFPPNRYPIWVQDLKECLAGLIAEPQIFPVSAHYALMARQLLRGEITLRDFQKDRWIVIPDPEDPEMPLSRSQIQPCHAQTVLDLSCIGNLEQALSGYLDGRHRYLILNVVRTLRSLYETTAGQCAQAVAQYRKAQSTNAQEYSDRIEAARKATQELEYTVAKSVDRVIRTGMDQAAGLVVARLDQRAAGVSKQAEELMKEAWTHLRPIVTFENGQQFMSGMSQEIDLQVRTLAKQEVKGAFQQFQEQVRKITASLEREFAASQIDYSRIMDALGTEVDFNPEVNLENMTAALQKQLEQLFEKQAKSISGVMVDHVAKAREQGTVHVLKPGFWNVIKGFFGEGDKVETHDLERFRKSLDTTMNKLPKDYAHYAAKIVREARDQIQEDIQTIAQSMVEMATRVVTFQLQAQQKQLESLIHDLAYQQGQLEALIAARLEAEKRLRAEADVLSAFEAECRKVETV